MENFVLLSTEVETIKEEMDVREWKIVEKELKALQKVEKLCDATADFAFQRFKLDPEDEQDTVAYLGGMIEIADKVFIYYNSTDRLYDFIIHNEDKKRIPPETFFSWARDNLTVPDQFKKTKKSLKEWKAFLTDLKEHMYKQIEENKLEAEAFLRLIEDEDIDWLQDSTEKVGAVYWEKFMFSFSIDGVTHELSQGIDVNPNLKWDWALFQEIRNN